MIHICLSEEFPENLEEFWGWISKKIVYLEKWGLNLNTKITPKALSLGQNQLISAIRSCFLKKPVVLFDEISSALDSELEEALREVVLIIQKNALTIIVAHRIETTMEADKILVMDEGRLIQEGNHGFLMENSEKYQDFIRQLSQ